MSASLQDQGPSRSTINLNVGTTDAEAYGFVGNHFSASVTKDNQEVHNILKACLKEGNRKN